MKRQNVFLVVAETIFLLLVVIPLLRRLPADTMPNLDPTKTPCQIVSILSNEQTSNNGKKINYHLTGILSKPEACDITKIYPDLKSPQVVTYAKYEDANKNSQLLAQYLGIMDLAEFERLIDTLITGSYIQYYDFHNTMVVTDRSIEENQQYISIFDKGEQVVYDDSATDPEKAYSSSNFLIEYRLDKSNGNIYLVVH